MLSQKMDQKFWLKYFRVYDFLNSLIPYRETLNQIVFRIKGIDLTILDVGCGTGNLIDFILQEKKVKKIIGIDYSEAALKIAKSKCSKSNIFFQKVDINNELPFEDNVFDYVVMNNVLYTIDIHKRQNLVKEIYRILKPGGHIIVSSINENFKPISIYLDHIKKSVSKFGLYKTIVDLIRFIKPTILIFYYNYLIKKENKIGSYDFVSINEQGALLCNAGFINIEDNVNVYSNNAYLTYSKK